MLFTKINGWEVGVLSTAMKTCQPGNTGVPPLSDPSCFGNLGGIYTSDELTSCTVPPIVDEDVGWTYGEVDNTFGGILTYGGVVDKLPGCNLIQLGLEMATLQIC